MLNKILDFIFSKRCGICGKKINSRFTCENCINIIEYSKGKIVIPKKDEKYYDKFVGLFPYVGILKTKMMKLKFENNRPIAKSLGELTGKRLLNLGIKADVVIPVPISTLRLIGRGFNQTTCIARYASTIANLNIDTTILKKVKNIRKQGGLSITQRRKNVEGIYKVENAEKIKNKDVMLFDDIYTTGATIDECSKVLKLAGARTVTAVAVLYSTKWKERRQKEKWTS